jgi:hypothetical protein
MSRTDETARRDALEIVGLRLALDHKERECASQRAIIISCAPYVNQCAQLAGNTATEQKAIGVLLDSILRAMSDSVTITPSPTPPAKGTKRKAKQ